MPDFASSRTTAVERLQAKAGRYRGSGETTTVKGYTKADGTVVPEYERAGGKASESKVQKLVASGAEASFNARFAATKNPTTVAGYKKMFDKVPTDQWGGGDVSISHKMPDGRRVWLYGDTLSAKNGFMHSTALVQKNGKLHVSGGGKQVIPNAGKDPSDPSREIIYWPDNVKQGPTRNTLLVSCMEMSVGTKDEWDFRKTKDGQSREALVKVDAQGNLKFVKFTKWTPTPTKNNPHLTNDFKDLGGQHYTYGKITHDIKLEDGSYLTTTSQNHTDGFEKHMGPNGFRFKDWRPIFGKSKKKR